MGLPLIKKDDHYTYGMYKDWPDEERWELIHGVAYNMSPAPSRKHQETLSWLFRELSLFLKDKSCKTYFAPFDVRLPEADEADDEAIDTVVQPDIVVFCDLTRLDDAGAKGAPDICVEVLSPSTSRKDLSVKFDLYERHGVKEYWVVDPAGEWFQVFSMIDNGKFDEGRLFVKDGVFQSVVLPGFELNTQELFESIKN